MHFATLYHVTPFFNIDSIQEMGLRPDFADGKMKVLWLAGEKSIAWSIAHVSEHKGIPVSELHVCIVVPQEAIIRRTRWIDVFTCRVPLVPTKYISTHAALLDEERRLTALEKRRIKELSDIPF